MDYANEEGWTVLYYAITHKRLLVLRELLKAGANPDKSFPIPEVARPISPLVCAAADGNVDMMAALVESGAAVNGPTNGDGADAIWKSPLIKASLAGHTEAMRFLIDHGSDVDYQAPLQHNWSALHAAALKGPLDAVVLLINRGAHIDCVDSLLATPLHLAVSSGDIVKITALLNAGAKMNTETSQKHRPLDTAYANWSPYVSESRNLLHLTLSPR